MEQVYIDQIRTGKLKTFIQQDETGETINTFESPLLKQRIKGKVWINRTGIIGDDGIDEREDTPDKALFAYSKEHYTYWQERRAPLPFHIGQMGENLVINGLNEYNTFIGDTYQLGDTIIQVSQPRLPCWRLAYHVDDIHFAKEVKESGHTGWHFRVLKTGYIREKDELILIDRPYPQWSIAACHELLHTKNENLNMIYELTKCHLLSRRWLALMNKRLKGQVINDKKRLYGSFYNRLT